MSEEIRRRAFRVIVNTGVLLLILTVTSFVLPGVLALIRQIPIEGLTISSALGLLLVIVVAFFGLRVLLDLIRLVDLTSDFLVAHIPGLRAEKRVSIVRALKEAIIVFVMVIVVSSASPFILLVPDVGFYLEVGVSVGSAVLAVILLYDAGRTLYAVFESGIELFIEKLARGK